MLHELRARGRRVVVHRGWAALAPIDDQEDGFVVDDVNHQALFPRVAAVVHHGGAGTTTAAARAGTPQVVVPQLADQPYWGARVAELGIGATASTVASLSEALEITLRSETRSRATAVAGSIRVDGAGVAARMLVALTGRSQPSPAQRRRSPETSVAAARRRDPRGGEGADHRLP